MRRTCYQKQPAGKAMSLSIRCEQGTQDNSLDVWLGRFAMIGLAVAIYYCWDNNRQGTLEVCHMLWVFRSKQKLSFSFKHSFLFQHWLLDTTCSFLQTTNNQKKKKGIIFIRKLKQVKCSMTIFNYICVLYVKKGNSICVAYFINSYNLMLL